MINHRLQLAASGVFAVVMLAFVTARADESRIDFGRQIRPLLGEKCVPCHGPDEKSRKGDLRLDVEESAFAPLESDEGFAFVRGDPERSVAYRLLVTDKVSERMPPRKSKKTLSKEEIALVRRWIDEGAPWRKHWSLVKPSRVALPDAGGSRWPRGAIDSFILARLRAAGLRPSPEAERTTLIRRVTFDLTGLPPTLEEIDDFLLDSSDDAYERVVDRLLDSPHYGEHSARYWLDAARYGDTHGLHLDNRRQMWPYRDWVIRAFNDNKPFDEFTIDQLAGDLLPEATVEQRIATGFNRCNVTTNEGGVILAEYDVHYTNDRVATMSTVWMGISMGCVTCHEHKFDPFDMKDFYQLAAFFNSLDGPVMDGNKPLPDPVLRAPSRENRALIAALSPEIEAARDSLEKRAAETESEYVAWEKAERVREPRAVEVAAVGLVGHWDFDDPEGDLRSVKRVDGKQGLACEVGPDDFVDLGDLGNFERSDAFSFGAWVWLEPGNQGGAVIARMDDGNAHRGWDLYVSGGRVAAHFIHEWPKNALKVETTAKLKAREWQHVFVTYDGTGKPAGVKIHVDGKASPIEVRTDSLRDTIRGGATLRVGRRSPGSPLRALVDDVRIYDRVLSAAEVSTLAGADGIREALALAPAARSPAQTRLLKTHYLSSHDAKYRELRVELTRLEERRRRLETEGGIATLVWRDRAERRPAHVLIRGAYDKIGERVYANTPAVLPPLPAHADRPEGWQPTRLELARWLVSPEHPLTSRVTVNRIWQQLFGVGLVETSEDFGSQGKPPSHPALLDWLAVDFRESGWNVKRLYKLIALSAVYQQSSRMTREIHKRDPENRLLARGPRFRLDAEAVRDNALATSGLLVRKIGGPSVNPYQPIGIWKAVGYTDSNTANFKRDSGDALYRRSVYTFWKRTAPPPSLVAFDAPSRETCTVRRSRTNTPLAALALMNDEQFVEASRQLAVRLMTEGGETERARAARGFRMVTARNPEQGALDTLLRVFRSTLATYRADPDSARRLIGVGDSKAQADLDVCELAAWTMVGNLLLNLDETITKE